MGLEYPLDPVREEPPTKKIKILIYMEFASMIPAMLSVSYASLLASFRRFSLNFLISIFAHIRHRHQAIDSAIGPNISTSISGHDKAPARAAIIRSFQNDPELRILIFSSVGNAGLNLSVASIVIFFVST